MRLLYKIIHTNMSDNKYYNCGNAGKTPLLTLD